MKNETKPVCMRLPEKWISCLKNKAREQAYKEKKDCNFHDLIRDSIASKYKDIGK